MRFARRWKLKCSLVRKERKIITRSVHQNSENEFRQTINETHNQSQTNFFVKLVKRNCWNYDNEILSSREKCKLKMATKLLTKTWTRWNINCLVWLHQVEHNRNNNWKNAKKKWKATICKRNCPVLIVGKFIMAERDDIHTCIHRYKYANWHPAWSLIDQWHIAEWRLIEASTCRGGRRD